MTPWLSVLVPVYNVEKYLAECLASVLAQADEHIEIIVLDDQSTDGSFTLLQELQNSSRVGFKILQHEVNKGLSGARNTLLRAATGTYIWFLDSDDCLVDGSVVALKDIVERNTPDLVLCDYSVWRPESRDLLRQDVHASGFSGISNTLQASKSDLFFGLYAKGKLHSWSKIAKRDLWLTIVFPEGKYFEDMATTPRLAMGVNSYIYVAEAWVKYRQREGSILAVPSLQKINDMVDANKDVLRDWRNAYPALSSSAQFAFIKYCVKVYFFSRRQLRKLKLDKREYFLVYRESLLEHTQTSLFGLMKWYLVRGQIFRLCKLILKF